MTNNNNKEDQDHHDQHKPNNNNSSTTTTTTTNPTKVIPITPDREKMSRALGAAFLQHKVQQLERNLDELHFRRDLNHYPNHSNHHRSSKNNHHHHQSNNRNPSNHKQNLNNHSGGQQSSSNSNPLPIKIIDTSLLIHALPILKKWVREAKFKIVIPLDVISELDFLKTSPPPISGLVREATCWLDSQFKNSLHQSAAISMINKPCFIPQRTGDECSWDRLREKFLAPGLEVASIPFLVEGEDDGDDDEGEEEKVSYRTLTSTDVPYQYRSLFQCVLYYQLQAQPNQDCELVVFFPEQSQRSDPPKTNEADPPSQSSWIRNAETNLLERKENGLEGHGLPEWAQYFQLKIYKVYPPDLLQAKKWARNEIEKQKQKKIDRQSHQQPISHPHSSVPPKQILQNRNRPAQQSASSKPASSADKRLFVW